MIALDSFRLALSSSLSVDSFVRLFRLTSSRMEERKVRVAFWS